MSNLYLALDDEKLVLSRLIHSIEEADEGAQVRGFSYAEDVLQALSEGFRPAVAFLDIEMPGGITGMELARKIKTVSAQTGIVFVTGFPQYALEAYSLHASGYLMKPVTREKVLLELENLRRPSLYEPKHRVRAQCFGNFEVFADGRPMDFRYNKTRELFAYLIDRKGALISAGELMAVLWEDKEDSLSLRNQLRNLVSDLLSCLKRVDAEDVLIKNRRNLAVDVSALDCDYYDFLNTGLSALNAYTGEYMTQYTWAEMTTSKLERLKGTK